MKKAIIRNNIILLLSIFTVFFIIVFFALYAFEKQNQKSLMSFIIEEVELEYTHFVGTPEAFILMYQSDSGRRITLLDAEGFVIADTHDDVIGVDKSERPEVKNLNTVYVRTSETVGIELLYIATRLEDSNILRISVPRESQVAAYNQVLTLFILTSLGFLGLYYVGLIQINKNLLNPWDKVKKGLLALNTGNYQMMSLNSPYEEINDILHELNMINSETQKHLNAIESYQDQLSGILNGLEQGVMLFDQEERLIYFNEDAKVMFDLSEDSQLKPAYYSFRSLDIKEAVTKVNQDQQPLNLDIKHQGSILEVRVFHAPSQGLNRMKATVLVLVRDVTETRKVEEMKRDFFSHASHELKSPITAIKGYAELIEHGLIPKEEIKDIAQKIVMQSEMMTALVEDMLMLSRLEHTSEKNWSHQNLKNILNEVIGQLEHVASTKQIQLKTHMDEVDFKSDKLDMHKLFKNIIENAIKYSDAEKSIDITLTKKDENILFIVKDQGYGIALEHQQRIFERFYRIDKGRLDGGTGLGLAIVKHIVIKYKGRIDLKSSLRKGTTITITFKA